MVMTVREFKEYMNNKKQLSEEEQFHLMATEMFKLAKTDEGMKDLLDRAAEYYVLRTE
ncbi:MAG TPA: hypothetical protein VFM18_17140 [Methanosarcina sp.]|nr:hypothetical protein [Methanosarcina sp.]